MRTLVSWSVVLVLTCVVTSVAAQTSLSESDALARLSAESPRARAITATGEVAQAEALGVGRWPNPRLSVSREAVAGVSETLTTVWQPLPVTGRRQLERAAAEHGVDAVRARASDDLRRVRADLRAAFADLVSAQVRERELGRSRDHLRDLVTMLEKREAAGDAAGFDRLRAAREALEVDADLSAAAADRARAQAQLASFFAEGTDPGSLVAEERAAPPPPPPPVDDLVSQAERTRGEVLALGQDAESARLSVRAAERRRVPEPEILAGTKTSTFAGGDVGSVLGLQAVVPIFDRGRPERALAEARTRQAEARLASLRVVLRADIAGWRAAALERRRAAEGYRAGALAIAGDVERIAQVSYDAGERGILELLDAYRLSMTTRVRQAALDASARRAEIELAFVSGWGEP